MIKHLLTTSLILAAVLLPTSVLAKSVTIDGQNDLRFSEEQIEVAPGEKVTIKLKNSSRLPASAMSHNWVLLKQGTDSEKFNQEAQNAQSNDYIPESMSDDIIAHTDMIGGGDSDTITFKAPEDAGDYEYICTFPGHYQAGMTGTLTVSDDD